MSEIEEPIQNQQMNDEINNLLFKAGMYISELKILAEESGVEESKNIFDEEGQISKEKIYAADMPNEGTSTSYDRFVLKLKMCLIKLGELINLKENIQANSLDQYLKNISNTLKQIKSDDEIIEGEGMKIDRCEEGETREQCQKKLDSSIQALNDFRNKIQEVLNNKEDEINGFKEAADKFIELKGRIDEQIKQLNSKGEEITDDEIDSFKEIINGIGETQEEITTLNDVLNELKENLAEKKKQNQKEKDGKEKEQRLKGEHAALSASLLDVNTETDGAEESKSGNIEESGNIEGVEDTLVGPTEGRESRLSIDGDAEFNEQIKKSDRNIEQIQKESQELDARIIESEKEAEKEVEKTLAGLQTITGDRPGKSKIPEGPPTTTDDDPPELPPPLDDESVTVGNQDDIQGPSETVESGNISDEETGNISNEKIEIVPSAPTSTEESIERNKKLEEDRLETSRQGLLQEKVESASERGTKPLAITPEDQKKVNKQNVREELLPADTPIEGDGQKVSETAKAGDTVETVPPLDEGDNRPVIALTEDEKKKRDAEERVGGRKRKQPKKNKRKSKKKSRRKSKKRKKKSRRKSKKKRN